MPKPNFFIVGAPKCGTTSLAGWLSEHPNALMSPIKEPHYYSTDLGNRAVTSRGRYEDLFKRANWNHRAIGEASTWYLYSRDAVPKIEIANPNARYIVMTRDLISMAHSLHHHNLRVLHEDQVSFEVAWSLQATRMAGHNIPNTCTEPVFLQYFEACSLGSQLHRLCRHVSRDRILHLPLADLQSDPAKSYRRVLDFLGLPDDDRRVFFAANKARGYRSHSVQRLIRLGGKIRLALGFQRGFGLGRLNEMTLPKEPLSDSFRAELTQAFRQEQQLLEEFNQGQT